MGTGLNWEMTRSSGSATSIPIVASGGVSRIEEIEYLRKLEPEGVTGVIIGRALYTGQIDIEEAIRVAQDFSAPVEGLPSAYQFSNQAHLDDVACRKRRDRLPAAGRGSRSTKS